MDATIYDACFCHRIIRVFRRLCVDVGETTHPERMRIKKKT